MFTWMETFSIEVDMPIHETWKFCSDPNTCLKVDDRMESCEFLGEFKTGASAKIKIKNRNLYFTVLFEDVKPFQEYRSSTNIPFFRQVGLITLQEISPEKTGLFFTVYVNSIFVPFMRSFIKREIEKFKSGLRKAFGEYAEKFAENKGNL